MCRRHKPRQGRKKALAEIRKFLIQLNKKVDTYMSETQDKLDALAGQLDTVSATLTQAADGLAQDIADLKQAVANGQNVDFSAVDARVEALKGQADALAQLDAQNPEQVPTPDPEPQPDPEQPQV